ncbi:MAG: SIR2 family NAD-dependent protein deacylase [Candidatus Zhuqueibacterota bacterium]
MDMDTQIDNAAIELQKADALLITAGAGIGVDSGLPDFRGNTGFWKAYPPMARLGISFHEMANPRWFDQDPTLAWGFYGHRLNLYRSTEPNAAFYQLKEIAEKKPAGYFIFTSNVDGQFQKAGFADDRIEECHGSIYHLQCVSNCNDTIWRADGINVTVDENSFRAIPPLPSCRTCAGLARPNVLMFGDWTWLAYRAEIQADSFRAWLRQVAKSNARIVVIEIGAGESVPTVRRRSETIVANFNARLIRINPRDYDAPRDSISIPCGAAEGMEKIYQQLQHMG